MLSAHAQLGLAVGTGSGWFIVWLCWTLACAVSIAPGLPSAAAGVFGCTEGGAGGEPAPHPASLFALPRLGWERGRRRRPPGTSSWTGAAVSGSFQPASGEVASIWVEVGHLCPLATNLQADDAGQDQTQVGETLSRQCMSMIACCCRMLGKLVITTLTCMPLAMS